MKLIIVINFLLLLTIASGKPKNGDFPVEEEPDMQNDDYTDYDDDSNVDGDEDDDIKPEILSKGQEFIVSKHENILLPCEILGNNIAVVMWRKNEDILFQDKIPLHRLGKGKYTLNNTSLYVTNVDQNDIGEYSCRLVMTDNSPKIVHTIKMKTPANIVNMNTEKNVREYKVGDTLVLMCNATGEPEPNITWSLAGKRFFTTGKNLIIEKLSKDNAGTYQCLADNGIGNPAHQSMMIHVNHKPIVHRIEKMINFNDGEDYNVELKCIVNSHPLPIVNWRKNGEVLTEGLYKLRNKNNMHSLTIMHVKEQDYGTFTCEAENQVGKDESHYVFTDKPSQPVYQMGDQLDENKGVSLVWEVESLYPIEEHTLMYKKKDGTEWIEEHPQVTNGNRFTYSINHTITNLEQGEYIVKVKSKNKSGWSEESKLTKFSGPKHKHHHGKNHYVYDKANEHSIQEAPEIAQTRLEETSDPSSSVILAPTTIIYLTVLTLLFSRRNI